MKSAILLSTILTLFLSNNWSENTAIAMDETVSICHTANVGYSVSDGKRMVLIDSIFRKIFPGDQKMPLDLLEKIISAKAPYDLPTTVLITHFHEDHFEAKDVITYLTNNEKAHALMPPQAKEKIMALMPSQSVFYRADAILPKKDEGLTHTAVGQVKGAELTVQAYYLDHNNPAQNVGYYFQLGGKSFYHLGDVNQGAAKLNKAGYKGPNLRGGKIDYLFIPFWYFLSPTGIRTVKEKFPSHHIIPTHLPEAEPKKKYFNQYGGHKGMIDHVINAMPNNILLTKTETCLPAT